MDTPRRATDVCIHETKLVCLIKFAQSKWQKKPIVFIPPNRFTPLNADDTKVIIMLLLRFQLALWTITTWSFRLLISI